MTPHEKLALETTANLMDAIATLAAANGAKSELMSLHLPNLSLEQRKELQDDLQIQLGNAQQLKENAKNLRIILARQ